MTVLSKNAGGFTVYPGNLDLYKSPVFVKIVIKENYPKIMKERKRK